jgi:hypothetical protein
MKCVSVLNRLLHLMFTMVKARLILFIIPVVFRDKDSRPNSPVQSDTEFEVQKITQESNVGEDEKSHGQSWRWGELPSPPSDGSLATHGLPLNTVDSSNPNNESTYLLNLNN